MEPIVDLFKRLDEQTKDAEFIKDLLIKAHVREFALHGSIPKQIPVMNDLMSPRFNITDQGKAVSYWYTAMNEIERIGKTYVRKQEQDQREREMYERMRDGKGDQEPDQSDADVTTQTQLLPSQQATDTQRLEVREYVFRRILESGFRTFDPGHAWSGPLEREFQGLDQTTLQTYFNEALEDFKRVGKLYQENPPLGA